MTGAEKKADVQSPAALASAAGRATGKVAQRDVFVDTGSAQFAALAGKVRMQHTASALRGEIKQVCLPRPPEVMPAQTQAKLQANVYSVNLAEINHSKVPRMPEIDIAQLPRPPELKAQAQHDWQNKLDSISAEDSESEDAELAAAEATFALVLQQRAAARAEGRM